MKNTQKANVNVCNGDLKFIETVIKDVYMKIVTGYET